MKIAVIGYSGSGKSTFAVRLAKKEKVPLLHLDWVHWLPGWRERPHREASELARVFMDEKRSWIIDGNYADLLYERRLYEADRIYFFDFNRCACLYRAIRRALAYRGRSRFSLPEGCDEKMDWEFALWILWDGRNGKHRRDYRRVLALYGDKTWVLKNQRDLDELYRALEL